MRTHISPDCRLRPSDLSMDQFKTPGQGSSRGDWVFTSAYTLYTEGLLPQIVSLAHQVCSAIECMQ